MLDRQQVETIMKNRAGKPICGFTIKGPKVGRHVVLWIKNCQRVVKHENEYCWQHRKNW